MSINIDGAGRRGRLALRWETLALRLRHAFALPALLLAVIVLFAGLTPWQFADAGQERYEYDAIGRLITHIDPTGNATRYQYDPAGNILSVKRLSAEELGKPSISAVAPASLRRGQAQRLTLTGANLGNVSVQVSNAALLVSNLQRAATSVALDMLAEDSTPLGNHQITLTNVAGSASVTIAVAPKLPTMSVEPSPLAFPPNGAAQTITVRLSNSDLSSHTVNLASSDAVKLTVSPASVQLPAGQTSATFSVRGLASGFANLQLTSPTLAPLSVPVFVTADFKGVNSSSSQAVGVMVGTGVVAAVRNTDGPFLGANVGVSLGAVVTGIAPRALTLGQSLSLVISGVYLPDNAQIVVDPMTGLTMGTPAVSADRRQISVPVQVAADAVVGPRLIQVRDSAGVALPFSDASLSNVYVTAGLPRVLSIEPLFGVGGTTINLKVRGEFLQGGALSFVPAVDLVVETPEVNADGTELNARVQIAPVASTGARTVVVTSLSGASSSQPQPDNQFTVVQQIRESVTPIASPLVGIQVGAGGSSAQTITVDPVTSPMVGVAVGAYGKAAEPQVGVLGTTVPVVIRGAGLQAVTTVQIEDTAGLTVVAPVANADGTELSFSVAVAGDAPRTLRRLRLVTATGELPMLDAKFLVSAALPTLQSVTPQVIKAGQTAVLNLQGLRLMGATSVRLEPSQGVVVTSPIAGSDPDTQATVSLQVASDAASGPRTVIVTTAAGESSTLAVPANTLTIASQVGSTVTPIASPLVGVQVGTTGVGNNTTDYLALSPVVGVMVQSAAAEPVVTSGPFLSPSVGLAVGPVANGLAPAAPDGFLKGSQSLITVTGNNLQEVSQLLIEAPAGSTAVVFGAPVVNAAGTQLQAPVTVAPDAPSAGYRLQLQAADGKAVPVAGNGSLGFAVGALPLSFDSTSTIVMEQGKTYTVTVRGAVFNDVYQVVIEGGGGVETVPGSFSVGIDAFSAYVTVDLRVLSTAPLGNRIVRLKVPGGMTSADPTPANTITITQPL